MSVQGTMLNPFMDYYNSYATMGDLNGCEDICYSSMANPMMYGGDSIFGGYNYNNYYNNMMQMQDSYYRYNAQNIELQRNNDIAINSPEVAINTAYAALARKIAENEQEQIPLAVAKFREAVSKKYPNANEQQIKDYLAYEYSLRSANNSSLIDDIKNYGSSSFVQGLKQGMGFGLFADNKTANENCAEIEGLPESRTSVMQKQTGRYLGGALTGATAGFVLSGFNPLGAFVGAILGCIGARVACK